MLIKLIFCLFAVLAIVDGAPRSRHSSPPHTVIDQKQTGENNIHIRLKDFQIIGLFTDESFGDYDYNYDYTDFTVKPPSNSTQNSTTTEVSPIISLTSTTTASTTTDNGPVVTISDKEPVLKVGNSSSSTAASNLESKTSQSTTPTTIDLLGELPASSSKPLKTIIPNPTQSSDKIKVHILQSPNVAIVPSDDISGPSNDNPPPLGEIMHYRRCLNGFTRDKKGRCKRIRRPGGGHQLSFDLSRLASNLASRLRHSSSADSSLSSIESF